MPVNEFFLDSPVESFNVGVHLGTSGIIMEMDDFFLGQMFSKILLKFRTIVGLKAAYLEGSDLSQFFKEIFGVQRRSRGIAISEGKIRFKVYGRNNVSSDSINEFFNGVYLEKVARLNQLIVLSSNLLTLLARFSDYQSAGFTREICLPPSFRQQMVNCVRHFRPLRNRLVPVFGN